MPSCAGTSVSRVADIPATSPCRSAAISRGASNPCRSANSSAAAPVATIEALIPGGVGIRSTACVVPLECSIRSCHGGSSPWSVRVSTIRAPAPMTPRTQSSVRSGGVRATSRFS